MDERFAVRKLNLADGGYVGGSTEDVDEVGSHEFG